MNLTWNGAGQFRSPSLHARLPLTVGTAVRATALSKSARAKSRDGDERSVKQCYHAAALSAGAPAGAKCLAIVAGWVPSSRRLIERTRSRSRQAVSIPLRRAGRGEPRNPPMRPSGCSSSSANRVPSPADRAELLGVSVELEEAWRNGRKLPMLRARRKQLACVACCRAQAAYGEPSGGGGRLRLSVSSGRPFRRDSAEPDCAAAVRPAPR